MQATQETMRSLAAWVVGLAAWALVAGVRAQEGRAPADPSPAARPVEAASGGESGAGATYTYGARARARRTPDASSGPTQATEAEVEALQADLGASFSLAESLPGSVPVFSGVPYLIVRGATPSGTAIYYDGILVPALFHIALGPVVVNPRLMGTIAFHPGVGPARYGRHTGGSLVVEAPQSLRTTGPQRELELTLLDAWGYLYAPELRTAVAWRIGDPGLLMNLLGLDATLNYYDYQVRHETDLGAGTELVLLGLGAGDQLGDRLAPENDIGLHFHRWVARLTRRRGDTTFGSQLVLGYDASSLGRELDGVGLRASPSLYVEHAMDRARLRIGADLLGTHVSLHRRPGLPAGDERSRAQSLTLDPEDFLDGQPFASLPTRGAGGVYAELHVSPLERLSFDLGVRADGWLSGSEAEVALSPSGRVSYGITAEIELYAALGLAHAPHGSPVPLPSLSDVSIDRGLEQALQAEVGANLRLPAELQLEAAYFHHRYHDVVYLELILDCAGNTDPEAAQRVAAGQGSICRGAGLPTADGVAQGLELYLKRNWTERISGFVSYTLSFAEATARDGTSFTPQSDVRHVANAVLRFDLGAGFALGARMHYRTGKTSVNTFFDTANSRFERFEQRLPSFFRADLRASYSWDVSFGRLEASVGVQNVTASSEPTNRDCLFDPAGNLPGTNLPVVCRVDYQRAIVLPNLGLRAEM